MDKNEKRSKYVLLLVFFSFMLVVIASYYNIFIKNDYEVIKQVDCDPAVDFCFVSDCESSDSSCDSTTTYKKISVPSKYAGVDYDSLNCSSENSVCTVITCEESTVEYGEKCFE